MALLDDIRAAQAQLEGKRRRLAMVTPKLLAEIQAETYHLHGISPVALAQIAGLINAKLDAAENPDIAPMAVDHQARAAGRDG